MCKDCVPTAEIIEDEQRNIASNNASWWDSYVPPTKEEMEAMNEIFKKEYADVL